MSNFNWPINPTTVNAGPLQFETDGLPTTVNEDTIVPANSTPLPVKVLDPSSGLPFDFATETTLLSVDALLTNIDLNIDSILTQAVDINSELDVQTSFLTTIDLNLGLIQVSTDNINTKLPAALGQQLAAASLGVVLASDQTLPLPAGAATEATLALLEAKDFATETTLAALAASAATEATLALVLTDTNNLVTDVSTISTTAANIDSTASAIFGDTQVLVNATGIDDDPAPTGLYMIGGQTSGTAHHVAVNNAGELLTRNNGIPNALGQAAAAGSTSVVLASDYAFPAVSGRSVVTTTRNDYSSVNVTTGAWVQLIASTSATINEIEIFDSSGQTLELGTGAAASETRLILVFPGGNGRVQVRIASGTRVSIRAVSGTANVGENSINYYA